ncbi:MAG: Wzz/FepE/Etk N-terminal domain-containing protein, partial [Bradyrhizobium sp.]|nr:Wzz/FepE/Etk N-terminal domain-containing protein [Bradyrhizobium sp.]
MLVYDRPLNQAEPAVAPTQPGMLAGFSVLELVRLLWQRKIAIVSAGLICACAAVMIGKSLAPKYSATAQLYVDPRELQLVDRELTPRAQDTSGLAMVVESQARLITSNSVLLQVIQDTNLDKDPEFGGGKAKGALASLRG